MLICGCGQCADITFRSSATSLNSSECETSAGIEYSGVTQETNGSTSTGSGDGSGDSTTGGSGQSAATATGINKTALSSVVGLALAFVFALSI